MIYYKYDDKYSPIGSGITYVETNEGLAYRQITVNGEKFMMSNFSDPEWGLILPEGEFAPRDDEAKIITKQEFDGVWSSHLMRHQVKWNNTKQKYPTGTEITGYIQIFYPQGVIVNLDEHSLGVANYAECRASAKPEWMYPGYRVAAIVADYDELNHWLVLEKPNVYGEILKDYRVNL